MSAKLSVDDELRRLRPVRIDAHFVGVALDRGRHRAALHAAEVEVGLVVDAPQLVGDELGRRGPSTAARRCRRVSPAASRRRWSSGNRDRRRACLPAAPCSATSRTPSCDLAVASLDRDRLRQGEHVPDRIDPRTDGDDDLVAGDRAGRRYRPRGSRRRAVADESPSPRRRSTISTPSAVALRARPRERRHVVRIAAALLVQHRGDVLRLPVVKQSPACSAANRLRLR